MIAVSVVDTLLTFKDVEIGCIDVVEVVGWSGAWFVALDNLADDLVLTFCDWSVMNN